MAMGILDEGIWKKTLTSEVKILTHVRVKSHCGAVLGVGGQERNTVSAHQMGTKTKNGVCKNRRKHQNDPHFHETIGVFFILS